MSKVYNRECLIAAVEAYYKAGENKQKAADALGIPRGTLQHRLKAAAREDIIAPELKAPELPPEDIDVPDIISHMCDRFEKRKKHADAKKWMTFKLATNKPIGITWFGDPHVDDDGCNWPLLKRDCSLVASTEGMYGANIGDTTNNWVGRLAALYGDQETSQKTGFRLAEWLFKDSGVEWLIMLMGNHDSWQEQLYLKEVAKYICPLVDWRAQFKLQFAGGREVLIDAAHDHKGHSQWNTLHAQGKASKMGGSAHLYIAGHRHTWALAQEECGETGRVYWLARARGYKFIDHYALVNGFPEQQHGSSIVTVIDPTASELNMIKCFSDVKEGCDYLNYLRNRK
jgi:hypothetical protein